MDALKWLDDLISSVSEACVNEAKGRMSGFSCRWAKPDQNHWGSWLVQIAPSITEFAGGKDDGATGFDFVDVDLLALPKCLDEIESFSYDPDYGNDSHLLLVGNKGKREVVVQIYFEPFEDDDPQTIFDANQGSSRQKEPDEE